MENLEFVDAHVHFYDMQHPVLTAAIGSQAFPIVNSSPLQRGHPDTSFQAYKMDELGATQPRADRRGAVVCSRGLEKGGLGIHWRRNTH